MAAAIGMLLPIVFAYALGFAIPALFSSRYPTGSMRLLCRPAGVAILVLVTVVVLSALMIALHIASDTLPEFVLGQSGVIQQALAGAAVYSHALLLLSLCAFVLIGKASPVLERRAAAKSVPRLYAIGELLEAAAKLRYGDYFRLRSSATSWLDPHSRNGSDSLDREILAHIMDAAHIIRVGVSRPMLKPLRRSHSSQLRDAYGKIADKVECFGVRVVNPVSAKRAQLANDIVVQAIALARFEDVSLVEQLPSGKRARRSLTRLQAIGIAGLAGAALLIPHLVGISLPFSITTAVLIIVATACLHGIDPTGKVFRVLMEPATKVKDLIDPSDSDKG